MRGQLPIHRPATGADPASAASTRLARRRLEPNGQLRGHAFFPPAEELAQIPSIPAVRRIRPVQRMLLVHYFTAYCDWYLCGLDPVSGEAYGYVIEPKAEIQLWSYFDLPTMCLLVLPADPFLIVRRDLRWRPTPAGRIIGASSPIKPSRPSSA
jgi:hypothetical protein